MSSAAVSPELFRRACSLFPTGVAVLTTRSPDGTPHGFTINAFCSLSLTPPLVLVSIDRACSLIDVFEHAKCFAVNFLAYEQRDLSVRFSELPEGRFSGISWSASPVGVPVLKGAIVSLECRTTQLIDAGDHRALIGEVTDAVIADGKPLVFFRSSYRQIS